MDLLIVVRGKPDQVASTRYRVSIFLPFLAEAGISYRVVYPPARRRVQFYLWPVFYARVLFWGCVAGTILIQKDLFFLPVWGWFKKAGKRIIYDFDDAVHLRGKHGEENVYVQSLGRVDAAQMVRRMLGLADRVLVPNQRLFQFASTVSRAAEVLPMAVDLEAYPAPLRRSRRPLIVGWIGSPNTVKHLKLLERPLRELLHRYPGEIEVQIVSRGKIPWEQVEYRQFEWSKEEEIQRICAFDIGVVPLEEEDEFAQGKSSYKLLQFMAAGLAIVASGVGFNEEVIRPGINGLLAVSTDEWIRSLEQLILSDELRWNLGQEARVTMEERFSVRRIAPRWVEIVSASREEEVVAGPGPESYAGQLRDV